MKKMIWSLVLISASALATCNGQNSFEFEAVNNLAKIVPTATCETTPLPYGIDVSLKLKAPVGNSMASFEVKVKHQATGDINNIKRIGTQALLQGANLVVQANHDKLISQNVQPIILPNKENGLASNQFEVYSLNKLKFTPDAFGKDMYMKCTTFSETATYYSVSCVVDRARGDGNNMLKEYSFSRICSKSGSIWNCTTTNNVTPYAVGGKSQKETVLKGAKRVAQNFVAQAMLLNQPDMKTVMALDSCNSFNFQLENFFTNDVGSFNKDIEL